MSKVAADCQWTGLFKKENKFYTNRIEKRKRGSLYGTGKLISDGVFQLDCRSMGTAGGAAPGRHLTPDKKDREATAGGRRKDKKACYGQAYSTKPSGAENSKAGANDRSSPAKSSTCEEAGEPGGGSANGKGRTGGAY